MSPSRCDSDHREIVFEEFNGSTHQVMLMPGAPADSFGPVEVPAGQYFVMGDNRNRSHDSRYFGFVDRLAIVGRATGVAASVNPEDHYWPRRERFFAALK